MMKNVHLTPNYTFEHVACRHCNGIGGEEVAVNARQLAHYLEKIRIYCPVRIIVLGWYRCPEHNEKVGGVKNSYHTKGMAVDLSAVTSHDRFLIVRAALEAGIKRIGIYDSFVHVDIGPSPIEVIWTK